ncbi:hypothetical protein PsYK624_099350 [Phanerochaete sordida]|uniref:Uncharacterized protein n=1 Tax=Phanerochaete sordida TaxID=48140 RepID=A0A9P3LGM1_9APHY|nr:hypothetical protein PsYK624_099350 [Phanerochaete sordida]
MRATVVPSRRVYRAAGAFRVDFNLQSFETRKAPAVRRDILLGEAEQELETGGNRGKRLPRPGRRSPTTPAAATAGSSTLARPGKLGVRADVSTLQRLCRATVIPLQQPRLPDAVHPPLLPDRPPNLRWASHRCPTPGVSDRSVPAILRGAACRGVVTLRMREERMFGSHAAGAADRGA